MTHFSEVQVITLRGQTLQYDFFVEENFMGGGLGQEACRCLSNTEILCCCWCSFLSLISSLLGCVCTSCYTPWAPQAQRLSVSSSLWHMQLETSVRLFFKWERFLDIEIFPRQSDRCCKLWSIYSTVTALLSCELLF